MIFFTLWKLLLDLIFVGPFYLQLLAGGYVAPATEGVAAFSDLRVDREGHDSPPLEPLIIKV